MQPTPESIAANPEAYASCPEVFGFAWAELKAARGQSIHPENLPGPMHLIIDKTPLITRIRHHARANGYRLAGDVRA